KKRVGVLACRGLSPDWTLAFSPDGKTLVSTCQAGKKGPRGYEVALAEVWDVKSRRVVRRFEFAEGVGGLGVILPDNRTLAVSGIDAALYDLTTGKELARLKGKHLATFITLSGDGRWLATADDRTGRVSLWDVRRRKRLWTITPWAAAALPPAWLALA